MFFGDDYYGYDDALYSAAGWSRSWRARDGLSHARGVPRFASTPEIRVDCPMTGNSTRGEAVRHFKRRYDVIDVDGARIGWWRLGPDPSQQHPADIVCGPRRSEERLSPSVTK